MNVLVSEKNTDSLLTAVFIAYKDKLFSVKIEEKGILQPSFDTEFISFTADKTMAERVEKALIGYAGTSVMTDVYLCLLSCEHDCLDTAFNYICRFFDLKQDVSENFADPVVLKFTDTVKKVTNERHRFLGFLRFSENENGILYAPLSPDNDIAELIAPHFLSRLSGIPFVIHDVKRNKAVLSNGKSLKSVKTDSSVTLTFSENETEFLNLWKKYFKAVNIKDRKNLKQQMHYMPKKYRQFAPETFEDN